MSTTTMGDKRGVVEELHRSARKNFPRRYVTIKGLNDLYQADIVEMRPYASENKGFHYVLTIIDVFSKRGWAVGLKTKSGEDVSKVLNSFFKTLEKTPKLFQTDLGKEFYNARVRSVLDKFNIHHYSTQSILKASVVERWNRTLKSWLWKEFSLQGNYRWLTLLDKVVERYNRRVHSSTGFAPIKVNSGNEKLVLARLMNKKNLPKKKKNKYAVGDLVRVSKYKNGFEKNYTANWTTEIFVIDKVQKTLPVTYKLRDLNDKAILGGFYELELQKTKYPDTYLVEKVLKRKKDKLFVKWLGFDDSYNQWIEAEDLEK